ncbi:hypothetical protein HDU67_009018 [Dinochytrium kinnereticum]|nr:hypothetical protein HDU67_009018 [Dinochytrium kinnereticum]
MSDTSSGGLESKFTFEFQSKRERMAAAIEENPRGIPRAPFMAFKISVSQHLVKDRVEDFVADGEVDATLRKFQEMIAKYRTMETHLLQRKASLESKLPELRKTLDMVLFLISRASDEEPIMTDFEVNDTLWVRSKISPTNSVYLWLGANVMLEYQTDEAKTLLQDKLATAKISLKQVMEDLEFLKEQITTMEVNFSRVHNWDVKMRREKKK